MNDKNRDGKEKEIVETLDAHFLKQGVIRPKRFITVEPILILFISGLIVHGNVFTQYLYFAVGREYNLTQPNQTLAAQCGMLNTSNLTQEQKRDINITDQIQTYTSTWNMYLSVIQNLISLLVTPFYAAYSDKTGRKPPLIIFCLGYLTRTTTTWLAMYFGAPLYAFLAIEAGSALFGGMGGCFACCMAYIADITEKKDRAFRIAIASFCYGVCMVGLDAGLGYWIKAQGYKWPYLPAVGFNALCLLYTIFLLPEVRSRRTAFREINVFERIKQSFLVYTKKGRATWCLVGCLMAFATFTILLNTSSITTIYQLNEPFCWESVKIGIFNAISDSSSQIGMMFAVAFLGRRLRPLPLTILGFLTNCAAKIIMGVGSITRQPTSDWMLYGTIPFNFFFMIPSPILRSYMSQLVPPDEQGALFGGLAIVQVLFGFIAALLLNFVYKATLLWYSGFVFLMLGGCCLIGCFFLILVIIADKKYNKRMKERLLTESQEDEDERLRTINT